MQYARSAWLIILAYGPAPADGMADDLGLLSRDWRELRGLRRDGSKVVGLTSILIRADCAPLQAEIEESPTIADAVAARFGLTPSRIDQQISAMVLDSRNAALRTRRTYHDGKGALLLASESIHPADRFIYSMSFNRERE